MFTVLLTWNVIAAFSEEHVCLRSVNWLIITHSLSLHVQ